MKKIIFLLPILFLLSCSSTTYIKTHPSEAKVYENNSLKGYTPYMHWDRESGGSKTFILKKAGYKDKTITITKSEFNPVRLIAPPIIALPWIYDYPYEHFYELDKELNNNTPSSDNTQIPVSPEVLTPSDNSVSEYARKLRAIKALKDEGLLTNEEYEKKRKSITDGM